ncbi:MAG: cytochrome c biogenesis protein CcsA [Campylobacteraceae bacterium]|jgi:cytochrome c-type biogenesis protein CcsB|nr:cytochrome c biogenesis protein CcsA [Campylobacteraceae bacterium]
MKIVESILKAFFSMWFMAFLLIIFALSCAAATFIENDFGTETAWAVVYAAKWFELVQLFLAFNLVYNILHFKLHKKEKLPAFIFHVSFLFILLGSALTRYGGYEGTLHIREGESGNIVKSSEPYIQIQAYKDGILYGAEYKKFISKLGSNDFDFSFNIGNSSAEIAFKEYVPNAVNVVQDDKNGVPTIAIVLSSEQEEAEDIILREGDIIESENVIFTFNKKLDNLSKPLVRFILQENEFSLISNEDLNWFKMSDSSLGIYKKGEKEPFDDKHLYTLGGINFAAKYIGVKGKEKIVSEKITAQTTATYADALIVTLTYKDTSKELVLRGRGRGYTGTPARVMINDAVFALKWGSVEFTLPFSIYLNDFQLERYPGSRSPSSYASEITLNDGNFTMDYRIYMNHVLDYKRYRFFQAFYDEDEGGTILSVNKDPGKLPTYAGYFLLSLGLFLNLLNPKSRFRKLASMVHKDITTNKKPKKFQNSICTFFLALFLSGFFNASYADDAKSHAENFSTILAQGLDGRIYPIDTTAREVLNKVYRKDSYNGLSANEVLLGMILDRQKWRLEPVIKVSHDELKKFIGISGDYASFMDFIDDNDDYKLKQISEIANRKKESERNQFDKDVIKVDERFNIVYAVFSLDMLRIVPKIGDENDRWYSIGDALATFPADEGAGAQMIFGFYFDSAISAMESNNWTTADKMINIIKEYQTKAASSELIPSERKIEAELFFNKAKIFDRIYPLYLLSGLVLMIFIFIRMAVPKFNIKPVVISVLAVNLITFVIHTGGLALRWYVAEHAPWSNSYESMIYIAWAIALAGLFFSRTSIISMALASIMAGITLFTAHLSWLDPQITNLAPVLKSHWLTIHVSIITASYGFLGLCALLGFFAVILYIIKGFVKNISHKEEIGRNITEAVRINEMSMILGLSLLIVGNFLGGVWANESWGRYWGWDPKETWALISILVYAVIVHFRFIPFLNGQFAFATASIFGYFSIIMTYFGVNFYLSGMHSYAAGDPVPVPTYIYVTVIVLVLTVVFGFIMKKESKRL